MESIIQNLQQDIQHQERIHIAVSGGIDSIGLLIALCKAVSEDQEIVAHHVKHNVSSNTQVWANFVEQTTLQAKKDFDVNITYLEHNLDLSEQKSNFESVAREMRYNAIIASMTQGEHLYVGHHADDQVENVLMNVLKGRGLKGITSLRATSNMKGIVVKRPFLSVEKKEVEQYIKDAGYSNIHDESNDSSDYDRNFVRNKVVPLVLNRFPAVKKAVMATYHSLLSTDMAMEELVADKVEQLKVGEDTYDVKAFNQLSHQVQKECLMYILRKKHFYRYGKKVLEELCRQSYYVEHRGKMNSKTIFKNGAQEVHAVFEKQDSRKVMVFH